MQPVVGQPLPVICRLARRATRLRRGPAPLANLSDPKCSRLRVNNFLPTQQRTGLVKNPSRRLHISPLYPTTSAGYSISRRATAPTNYCAIPVPSQRTHKVKPTAGPSNTVFLTRDIHKYNESIRRVGGWREKLRQEIGETIGIGVCPLLIARSYRTAYTHNGQPETSREGQPVFGSCTRYSRNVCDIYIIRIMEHFVAADAC